MLDCQIRFKDAYDIRCEKYYHIYCHCLWWASCVRALWFFSSPMTFSSISWHLTPSGTFSFFILRPAYNLFSDYLINKLYLFQIPLILCPCLSFTQARLSLSKYLSSCCGGLFGYCCLHYRTPSLSLSSVLESVRQGRWIQVEEDRRDLPARCHHFVAPPKKQIDSCFIAWETSFEIPIFLPSVESQWSDSWRTV